MYITAEPPNKGCFVHHIERLSSSLCTVEPLNKIGTSYCVHYRGRPLPYVQWYLQIKDTLGQDILSTIERLSSSLCTVEPRRFVHYREVVLYSGTSE